MIEKILPLSHHVFFSLFICSYHPVAVYKVNNDYSILYSVGRARSLLYKQIRCHWIKFRCAVKMKQNFACYSCEHTHIHTHEQTYCSQKLFSFWHVSKKIIFSENSRKFITFVQVLFERLWKQLCFVPKTIRTMHTIYSSFYLI